MIEVICAGSLFLSTNIPVKPKSIDFASIDMAKSSLVQANIGRNQMYLADNESESGRNTELERLFQRFNIIIDDSQTNTSDRDADERRRELELEDPKPDSENNNNYESDYRRQADEAREENDIFVPDSDSDSDRDADERRRELEIQQNESYPGEYTENEHQSDYRRQADEAREGSEITVPNSNSDSDSDRDADERRRELEDNN